MTLDEIKAAVRSGRTVHWSHEGYVVREGSAGFVIVFVSNGCTIGLTWLDGVTMNGRPEEFFVGK